MRRLILALALASTVAGCGADSLLQSPGDRREEIASAVAEALEAEKGWQTRFVERRTETMLSEQQAIAERTAAITQRTKLLEDRLDDVARRVPSVADPGFGRANAAVAPAASAADQAEIEALRHDLAAMTTAVGQLLNERDRAEAAVRARFERLEIRTSQLGWPDGGGDQGVHLASYRTHEAALRGWEQLQDRHRSVLSIEAPTFVEVETVAGRYVRLFVGVGLPEPTLLTIRDGIRRGGDYAMVLPLPVSGPGS